MTLPKIWTLERLTDGWGAAAGLSHAAGPAIEEGQRVIELEPVLDLLERLRGAELGCTNDDEFLRAMGPLIDIRDGILKAHGRLNSEGSRDA